MTDPLQAGLLARFRGGLLLFSEGFAFLRAHPRVWGLAVVPVLFAVLAVGAVFLVLVIAIIYSNSARLDAERRLQETESTLAFVDSSIGDAIDPSYGGGRDLLAVDYFANAYGSIERDASLSPRVQVRLYEMYARVLLALNDYELGAECARAGLAVIERNRLDSEVAVSANELRTGLTS